MNNEALYDVAIIGGGLAGLSLAIQCASRRYKVALFEKEEYPFHKVCGEYISLESWNFLQSLGLDLQALDVPLIKELSISDAKGRSYTFHLPLGGFGISRYSLDNSLYKIAVDRGAEVYTNTRVNDVSFDRNEFNIITSAKSIRAKLAAGCFGKRSNLDVKWKRAFTVQKPGLSNNYVGVKYHIRYDHPRQQIVLHNFKDGYCGMSAIEEGKSCLCYMTTASSLRKSDNSIGQLEKEVLHQNPHLRDIFSSAEFLYKEPLVISQINFGNKRKVENGVLMLGDAAGLISPLCGNGMSMALHSSKLAFTAIDRLLLQT